jgi:RNA polymerase sigma-70 factor (ECF subfamily)
MAQLAQRWHPRLLRTARRLVGSELAPVAVQESWVAILKGLRGLRDPSRFAPFAFIILHRRVADLLNQRRPHEDISEMEIATPPAQGDAAAITQAFARLPLDQRLAAQLFFVEGMSLAEIAEVQAVPLGTAKSRLFHARQKLKLALLGDDQ